MKLISPSATVPSRKMLVLLTRCNMIAGQVSDRQFVDLLECLQQYERPAEREREVTCEEPPEVSAERQRAESLEPSQINLSSAVDTVEHDEPVRGRSGADGRPGRTRPARPGRAAFRFPRETASRRLPSVVKPRETIRSIISSTSL